VRRDEAELGGLAARDGGLGLLQELCVLARRGFVHRCENAEVVLCGDQIHIL